MARLRTGLAALGPVFAGFGFYLSSRFDLLTAAEALEMGETSERQAASTTYEAVKKLWRAELSSGLESSFSSFEQEPFDASSLFQWHRARLSSGERVIVKVVHPELDGCLEPDLALLHGAGPSLAEMVGTELTEAVADYDAYLRRSIDLRQECEDLVRLRAESTEMRSLTVPEVLEGYSGERVLTLEDLVGSTVEEWLDEKSQVKGGGGGTRIARRLCREWLTLALSAALLPIDPRGRNALVIANDRIAFCGGPFSSPSAETQRHLRNYLAATAVEDYEGICRALLELTGKRQSADERSLRYQLRHVEPFRDGGWDLGSDDFSRSLLAYWRQSSVLGFRPKPAFLSFLRGLSHLTQEVRRLTPGESPVREAFQEIRLHNLLEDLRRIADGSELEEFFRRQASLVFDLPRKLDRFLTVAAAGGSRPQEEKTKGETRPSSWTIVPALLMALAAVAVLVHYLRGIVGSESWIEAAGAVAMLALGAFLLRLAFGGS